MRATVSNSVDARRQALELDAWWRQNRTKAPSLFSEELLAAYERLAESPELGTPYHELDIPGVRRLLLRRTRYVIYYLYDSEKAEILVLGLWGAARGRPPQLKKP